MRPKEMEDLAAFDVREQQQKKETSIPLQRTVRVKVGGKAIPASFLQVEGRRTLVGAIGRRERDR